LKEDFSRFFDVYVYKKDDTDIEFVLADILDVSIEPDDANGYVMAFVTV